MRYLVAYLIVGFWWAFGWALATPYSDITNRGYLAHFLFWPLYAIRAVGRAFLHALLDR